MKRNITFYFSVFFLSIKILALENITQTPYKKVIFEDDFNTGLIDTNIWEKYTHNNGSDILIEYGSLILENKNDYTGAGIYTKKHLIPNGLQTLSLKWKWNGTEYQWGGDHFDGIHIRKPNPKRNETYGLPAGQELVIRLGNTLYGGSVSTLDVVYSIDTTEVDNCVTLFKSNSGLLLKDTWQNFDIYIDWILGTLTISLDESDICNVTLPDTILSILENEYVLELFAGNYSASCLEYYDDILLTELSEGLITVESKHAMAGDTSAIPLHLTLPEDSLFSSFNISINDCYPDLIFTRIDTISSDYNLSNWNITYEQNQTLNIFGNTLNDYITGDGILFDLVYYAPYTTSGVIPIQINSATVDGDSLSINNGMVNVINIVINEIMQNPSVSDDANGEWFELYNRSGTTLDLSGWIIRDCDTDYHEISGDLFIEPYSYIVLGNSLTSNGGVHLDYQYSGISLGNSSDELLLISPWGLVDSVAWDNGIVFPDPNGASMAFIEQPVDNANGENWFISSIQFGDGDYGTPGLPNNPSDIEVYPASLQFPNTMAGLSSELKIEIKNNLNNATNSLLIDTIFSNNGVFYPGFCDTIIQPGDSVLLSVYFYPDSPAVYTGELAIYSNDYDEKVTYVSLYGTGLESNPDIFINTDSLFFYPNSQDSSSATLKVYNIGLEVLEIEELSFSNPSYLTSDFSGASVNPGDSVTIEVLCTSSAEVGTTEEMSIISNDPETPEISVKLIQKIINSTGFTNGFIPDKFILENNYPNPFNNRTVIRYGLPIESYVSIKIYDLRGNLVKTLLSKRELPGYYSVAWDAKQFSSGIYLYTLESSGIISRHKMVLLK